MLTIIGLALIVLSGLSLFNANRMNEVKYQNYCVSVIALDMVYMFTLVIVELEKL